MADNTVELQLLIENQQLIASGLASGAANVLSGLLNINVPFTPKLGPPGEVDVVPPDLSLLDIPPYVLIPLDKTIKVPTSGKLTDVSVPPLPPLPPDKTPQQPDFTLPSKPAELGAFQGTVPTLDPIPSIDPLDVTALLAGIPSPYLAPITIGTAPSISLPEFGATLPGAPPIAPTDLEDTLQDGYETAWNISSNTIQTSTDAWFRKWFPNHAAQVATLEARLDTYLAGGTGVDPEVASAIYEIERSKRDAEYRRVDRTSLIDAGKRGQVLPDGVLLAAQINARTAAADGNAGSLAELRKLLFDKEQQNLQFAVTNSIAWRGVAVQAYQGMFNSYVTLNGQCIEYAKEAVQALVETFNAAITGYKAAIELYQAEAWVYAEKLRAALAPLELFRAQLEAQKLIAEVDEVQVRVYEARIHAVSIIAEVYKLRIEAIVAQANLQRLKFEVFDAQVRAFAALVSAKEAEFQAYSAEIGGEVAKQQAWAEAIRARVAQLEGFKAQVEALTEQTRLLLAYNESITRQYEAAVRAYGAQIQAQETLIQGNTQQYTAEITGISSENEAKGRIASLKLEEWKTGRELVLKKSEQEIVRAKAEAEVKLGSLGLQVSVAEAIASNYSRMAQAALSGITASMSSGAATSV